LLPLLRVIPTHTPSLLMLRHSHVVHSCVVHPCFFVPPCPLPRCPPLLLRATLSTLAMSTPASSCRLVHSRVFNPCFFARATLSTPAISVDPLRRYINCLFTYLGYLLTYAERRDDIAQFIDEVGNRGLSLRSVHFCRGDVNRPSCTALWFLLNHRRRVSTSTRLHFAFGATLS